MIQETLQQPYDRSRWTALLAGVFPNVSIYKTPQKSEEGAPEFVRGFLQLGNVRLEDGKNLAIFEVKVTGKPPFRERPNSPPPASRSAIG